MRSIFERVADREPRFIAGTVRELEELFGSPLPELPEVQPMPGEAELLLVDLHPTLAKALRDLVEFIYKVLTTRDRAAGGRGFERGGGETPFTRFEEVLEAVLTTIIERERRLGLLNLFWLAHSKSAAELVQEFFSRPGVRADVKYQIHPLLQGAYRNTVARVWTRFKSRGGHALRHALGADFNSSLVDCIIDDQLPLTEIQLDRLNFAQLLVENNKRFRLGFREFKEIVAGCRERLREGLQRKELRLLELLRRALPTVRPEQYEEERQVLRLLFSSRVLAYLLADLGGLGMRLTENPTLQSEVSARRGWSELLLDYQDLVQSVKRSEAVDLLRQSISLAGPEHSEGELRTRFAEGRLFRFYPREEVLKLARKVTVIFADLRGFTRASEGGVSEMELTDRLYEVFDPLAAIVERFHGRIDKFTGDGVMITFGSTRVTREDELNALRTAIAVQEMMASMREVGRTQFVMGISVHTGRAQLAHFILDDHTMDRTVIGRNVNIAGRLSGSGKSQVSPFDEGEDTARPLASPTGPEAVRDVWVDAEGTLYNSGIAVSQDTVEELLRLIEVEPLAGAGGGGYRFYDEGQRKKVLLEYVGDVKFRGVDRSLAIFRLGVEGEGPVPSVGRPGGA